MSSDVGKLFVFGDSGSDMGSFFNFTGDVLPEENNPFPFLYPSERFSNGAIWVDYLTDKLNRRIDPFITGVEIDPVSREPILNFEPSENSDGVNFAIGSASSGSENTSGIAPIGLEAQIDVFEFFVENMSSNVDGDDDDDDDDGGGDDGGGDDDNEFLEDSLSMVWIGANDYMGLIQDNPTTPDIIETYFPNTQEEIQKTVSTVVENIEDATQKIIDAGVENVAVFNLPDLDKTPLARRLDRDSQQALKDLTGAHNDLLLDALDNLEDANDDLNLIYIDIDSLFDRVIANPTEFGFTNVTDNFSGIDILGGAPQSPAVGNPDEYLFWDGLHATTAGHELIADFVMDELENADVI